MHPLKHIPLFWISFVGVSTVVCLLPAEPLETGRGYQLHKRKYIDVCPKGKTTGCKKIGISDVDPKSPEDVKPPAHYESGKDYSTEMEAAPVTVTPTKSIDGETSFFTTSSQTVTDGTHIILPVVFPLPPGAPVPPPIPPEDGPGPGAPEAPDEPDKHEDSSSTTKGAEFCTKPTPMSIASLVTATPEASLNPFTGEPPDDKPSPECEHGKEVSIKGLDPETLNDLAGKFCKDGMGSTKSTLDMTALDPNADTMGLSVDFAYDQHTGNCPSTCVDSFKNIIETCQHDSHTIIGKGSFKRSCGDYSFSIQEFKPFRPAAWPTATAAACFSGTPQGGKKFHGARASQAISSACAAQTEGSFPPRHTLAITYADSDDKGKADPQTSIQLFANGDAKGKDIPGGADCTDGFFKALNNCPGNPQSLWGGSFNHKDIQWSIYGYQVEGSEPPKVPKLKTKRGEPPREMRLYAYANCTAPDCERGYAIADTFAFSPPSICDYGDQEIRFQAFHDDGKIDTRFKTYGHEQCTLVPNGTKSVSAGTEWGRLGCKDGLKGRCTVPVESESVIKTCGAADDGVRVSNGRIMHMMAACKF